LLCNRINTLADGETYFEVALTLGISEAALKQRVSRSRQRLRLELLA
jgi:DNA-directed RNA polymerase specialized sigma24 family protein